MKKRICILMSLLLLFSCILRPVLAESTDVIPEPTLSPEAEKYDEEHPERLAQNQLYALSAILVAEDTGEVIFEKDPDERRYPASVTKILTVLLGITYVEDLNQKVIVSERAVNVPSDSSTMHLQAGEEIPFIDVLYGTMLVSGNDGANVIAETVSGSIENFVDLMNQWADAYGCTGTHFANPHGYHDPDHYSTARDLAVIARFAMQNDTFRQIASATSYNIARTNKQRARTLTTKSSYMLEGSAENPNKYYFPYATGIKTGSHSMSGWCFAGAAEKEGVRLISVVLFTGNRARWADTIKLMNYGFSQYVSMSPRQIYEMNPLVLETSNYSTRDSDRGKLRLTCVPRDMSDSTRITTTKKKMEQMSSNIRETFDIQITRDLICPIQAGDEIGTMTYYPEHGDPVVYSLLADRTIDRRENAPKSLEEIILETYNDPNPLPGFSFALVLFFVSPVLLVLVLAGIIILIRRRRRASRMRIPKPAGRYVK